MVCKIINPGYHRASALGNPVGHYLAQQTFEERP